MAGKFEYRDPRSMRAYAEGRDRAFGQEPRNGNPPGSEAWAAYEAGYESVTQRDSTARNTGNWPPYSIVTDGGDPIITDGGDPIVAV
jgi:hypothetical protein